MISNLSMAQKVKLSDLHGTWVSGLRESSFIVFVNDSMMGLGFSNLSDVYINYSKVGFIDRNNQSLIGAYKKNFNILPNEEVRMVNFDVPEDMNIEIMTEQKNENDYFYYGGTLCYLGIEPEDLPSKVGS